MAKKTTKFEFTVTESRTHKYLYPILFCRYVMTKNDQTTTHNINLELAKNTKGTYQPLTPATSPKKISETGFFIFFVKN